jgi:hypothetical protein
VDEARPVYDEAIGLLEGYPDSAFARQVKTINS